MATEKLREGISKFAADAVTLKDLLKQKIQAQIDIFDVKTKLEIGRYD